MDAYSDFKYASVSMIKIYSMQYYNNNNNNIRENEKGKRMHGHFPPRLYENWWIRRKIPKEEIESK
jgi:hypothetical protein